MTKMSETEKKRVAEQRTALGEEGLKIKRQRLDKATQENEVCSPSFSYLPGGDLSVVGMQNVYDFNFFHALILLEASGDN